MALLLFHFLKHLGLSRQLVQHALAVTQASIGAGHRLRSKFRSHFVSLGIGRVTVCRSQFQVLLKVFFVLFVLDFHYAKVLVKLGLFFVEQIHAALTPATEHPGHCVHGAQRTGFAHVAEQQAKRSRQTEQFTKALRVFLGRFELRKRRLIEHFLRASGFTTHLRRIVFRCFGTLANTETLYLSFRFFDVSLSLCDFRNQLPLRFIGLCRGRDRTNRLWGLCKNFSLFSHVVLTALGLARCQQQSSQGWSRSSASPG